MPASVGVPTSQSTGMSDVMNNTQRTVSGLLESQVNQSVTQSVIAGLPAVLTGHINSLHNSPYSTNKTSFDSSKVDIPILSILGSSIASPTHQPSIRDSNRPIQSLPMSGINEHVSNQEPGTTPPQQRTKAQVSTIIQRLQALPSLETQRIESERCLIELKSNIEQYDKRIIQIIIQDENFHMNENYKFLTKNKDQNIKQRIAVEEYKKILDGKEKERQMVLAQQREEEMRKQLKTPPYLYIPSKPVQELLKGDWNDLAAVAGASGTYQSSHQQQQPSHNNWGRDAIGEGAAHGQLPKEAHQMPHLGGLQIGQADHRQAAGAGRVPHIGGEQYDYSAGRSSPAHFAGRNSPSVASIPGRNNPALSSGMATSHPISTLQSQHVRIQDQEGLRLTIHAQRDRNISGASEGSTPCEYKGACPTCKGITNYYADICENCATEIPEYVKRIIPPSPLTPLVGSLSPNSVQFSEETSVRRLQANPPSPEQIQRHHRTNSGSSSGSTGNTGVPGQALQWICGHCTFINPAGTWVCNICNKTTAKAKYIREKKQDTPAPDEQPTYLRSVSSEPRSIFIQYQEEEERVIQ